MQKILSISGMSSESKFFIKTKIYHTYYNHGNDIIHIIGNVYWLESPTTILGNVHSEQIA